MRPFSLLLTCCGAVFSIGLGLAAESATAKDFCIAQSESEIAIADKDCASGGGLHDPSAPVLQTVLNNAAISSPGADRVLIGPYTIAGKFSYNNPDEIEIVGAGQGKTVIEAITSGEEALSLAGNSGSSVSDLSFQLSGDGTAGLGLTGGADAKWIKITSGPSASSQSTESYGIRLHNGFGGNTTVANVDIAMPGQEGTFRSVGISRDNCHTGKASISDIAIFNADEGFYLPSAAYNCADISISRAWIRNVSTGVLAVGPQDIRLSDSLIAVDQYSNGVKIRGSDFGGAATADLQRMTLVGGSYSKVGIESSAEGDSSSSADVTVTDSIVDGFNTALLREATDGSTASIGMVRSAYDSGKIIDFGGNGAISPTDPSYLGIDPKFVAPNDGNFHLRWDSPLIDRGSQPVGQFFIYPLDLDDLARNVDGDQDGTVNYDLGAYEYGRRKPVDVKISGSKGSLVGQKAAFAGSAKDPDPGDTLTYAWSFDDGTTAEGDTVKKAFTTIGTHTVTLTVTDPTDQSVTVSAQVDVVTDSFDGGKDKGGGGAAGGGGLIFGGGGKGTGDLTDKRPTSRIKRPAKAARRAGKLKVLSGTARDDKAIKSVKISITKRIGKGKRARCVALKSNGRFQRDKPANNGKTCKPKFLLKAKGTTNWKFNLRKALGRGVYTVSTQATDSKGQRETARNTSNQVRLRVSAK